MKKYLTAFLIIVFVFLSAVGASASPYNGPMRSNYNEYLDFLDENELPENFVYYEDLSFLGRFYKLEVSYGKDYKPDFTKDYYYEIISYASTRNNASWYKVRCPAPLAESASEIFGKDDLSKEQILEICEVQPGWTLQMQGADPSVPSRWGFEPECLFSLSSDELDGFEGSWFLYPELYPDLDYNYTSPFVLLSRNQEEMIRTLVYATLQPRYKKEYKSVLDSFRELCEDEVFRENAFDIMDFEFLGMLSSYEFEPGSGYKYGEFRFATSDPEIEIVLTVEPADRSETWDVPKEMPEGSDLRGKKFYREESGVVFLGDSIVLPNKKRKVTITTSPQSALAEYPQICDGGGFLAQLLSAETNEYCTSVLSRAANDACEEIYIPARYQQHPDFSTDSTVGRSSNSGYVTPTDEGTVDVSTETATLTDAAPTDGTDDALSTDGNASDAPLTDGTDAPPSDTPADPTPFPWVWVIVPAGVVLVGGGTAALLLLRKKKKQES